MFPSTPEKSWSPKREQESRNGLIEVPARPMKNPVRWLLGMTVTVQDAKESPRFIGCERDGIQAVKNLERGKRGHIVIAPSDPNIERIRIGVNLYLAKTNREQAQLQSEENTPTYDHVAEESITIIHNTEVTR